MLQAIRLGAEPRCRTTAAAAAYMVVDSRPCVMTIAFGSPVLPEV